jgi:hypothetical protein
MFAAFHPWSGPCESIAIAHTLSLATDENVSVQAPRKANIVQRLDMRYRMSHNLGYAPAWPEKTVQTAPVAVTTAETNGLNL